MSATSDADRRAHRAWRIALALALVAACNDGNDDDDDDDHGPPPPLPESTTLSRGQDAPGLQVEVLSVTGGSGSNGSFRVGDRVRVRFTVEKDDGGRWGLAEFGRTSAMVSGPTFNHQRVIAEREDVAERASTNADGSYSYVFPPLPSTYLAPYNDTPSFGTESGELTGQALLAGTYTLALGFAWDYTVDGEPQLDVGETTASFLFGTSTTLAPREVTTSANCNQCHVSLRAHEGRRRDVAVCVLCHTSGAEDLNDPSVAGGTPGRTIDMRVMVHKIHNARHLPSVNGSAVDALGDVIYGQAPVPYVLADSVRGARDYSAVGTPVGPARTQPLPRDFGHSSLSLQDQATEERIRSGLSECRVCHGDPDGAGPLGEPAQGQLVFAQPTTRACGACHDDLDITRPYRRNQQEMPPQTDDSGCATCHLPDGGGFYSPLAVSDGHLHPLHDPGYTGATNLDFTTFFGLVVDLIEVREAGANDGDGSLDPGEKVELRLTVRNDTAGNVPNNRWDTMTVALSGPSHNANLLHETVIHKSQLSGLQPFTARLPEAIQLELVGVSSGALGDVFMTARTPHIAPNALTRVFVRSAAAGGDSFLLSRAEAAQNFLDVADATGFARDDYAVIEDGAGAEEYVQIQFVDGDRLWLSSPATPDYKASLALVHPAGATVREVTLTQLATNQYSINASQGQINETSEFGAGVKVIASYTTEYVVPDRYPAAANDSPDLGETAGQWTGKLLEPGTYRLSLSVFTDLVLSANLEDSNYRHVTSDHTDVMMADPASLEPYELISSGSNCNACHQRLDYHEGRFVGFDTCIACHAAAGAEDRPRYVAANAPQTPATSVTFRQLVHALHRGAKVAASPTFSVSAAGTGAYPDNYEQIDYDFVNFPADPGGVARCAVCHGATNTAWIAPADRTHSSEQTTPTLSWRAACMSCHESSAAAAHYELNTTLSGVESCAVCHGPSSAESVEVVHRQR